MIKTDAYADKDSDLFLSELKLSLKDKLIEFVNAVSKESDNDSLIDLSEYDDIFTSFWSESDLILTVYLDENDEISISVGFSSYISFSSLSAKDKSKCRQFHIIKLNPHNKYQKCFENLCYGRAITDEELDDLVDNMKNKILSKHSEINLAKLEVLYALQDNNGETQEPDWWFDSDAMKWFSDGLLFGPLKLHKKFDPLFSTRSISDNFVCDLPTDIFEHYIYCKDSVIDIEIPILDVYPKALMKTIEFIDCKDGSGIEDLCNKIIIFSELDRLFLIHKVMENIKYGHYENVSKRYVSYLYYSICDWSEKLSGNTTKQDPRIETYTSNIVSYLESEE